jgi:hypothetical protein
VINQKLSTPITNQIYGAGGTDDVVGAAKLAASNPTSGAASAASCSRRVGWAMRLIRTNARPMVRRFIARKMITPASPSSRTKKFHSVSVFSCSVERFELRKASAAGPADPIPRPSGYWTA